MVRRKNVPRSRGKQTSTPLKDRQTGSSLKSPENISIIPNENSDMKRSVFESPSLPSRKNCPKIHAIKERYKKISIPSKKLTRRRIDTPIKSQKISLFKHASTACPTRLKFPGSSNTNSKFSYITKHCSGTVIKHLLHTHEEPENKHDEVTSSNSFESFESMTDSTQSEFSYNSDPTESCRRESITTIISNAINYTSDLDTLNDEYISSSPMGQSFECSDNAPVLSESLLHYLEKKSCDISRTEYTTLEESLPEVKISFNCVPLVHQNDEIIIKECEVFKGTFPNEIEVDEMKTQNDDKVCTRFANLEECPSVENEECDCRLNFHEDVQMKCDEKQQVSCKCNGKNTTKSHNLERKVCEQSGLLNSNDTKVDFDENVSRCEAEIEIPKVEKKSDAPKNPGECQVKDVTISINLENERVSLTENQLNEQMQSSKYATKNIDSKNGSKINEKIFEKKKKYRAKSENERVRSRKQEKKVEKNEFISNVVEPVRDSDSIECGPGAKMIGEVKTPVEKNAISRRIARKQKKKVEKNESISNAVEPVRDSDSIECGPKMIGEVKTPVEKNAISRRIAIKGRKTKITVFSPFTSTSSVRSADDKGTLVVKCDKRNKSCDSGYILKHRNKTKKACAKSSKICPRSKKQVSRCKSFEKTPPYQKMGVYCVGKTNSRSNANTHLFKSSTTNVNKGIPVDDILLFRNRWKKRKTSQKRKKRDGGTTNSFETAKQKNSADYTRISSSTNNASTRLFESYVNQGVAFDDIYVLWKQWGKKRKSKT